MPKHKSYIGGNETQFGYEKKISMFCIDNYTKPVFKINAKIPLFLYW